MPRPARLLASAALAGAMVLTIAVPGRAQSAVRTPLSPAGRVSPYGQGGIVGVVQDDQGRPISGAVVTVLGATTTFTVTESDGRFEFGPWRRDRMSSARIWPATPLRVAAGAGSANGSATASDIHLKKAGTPILAAGIGVVEASQVGTPVIAAKGPGRTAVRGTGRRPWRNRLALRHARRGVLKDVTIPEGCSSTPTTAGRREVSSPAMSSAAPSGRPARMATNFFADTPISGQVNLLAAGTFDTPQQLFSAGSAPATSPTSARRARWGNRADWTVSGALTQADISSWIVAGAYTIRTPARHGYDVGHQLQHPAL